MNKTALITGASRGIGADIARVLAQDGYRVIVNYNMSEDQALSLEEELVGKGAEVHTIQADVSDTEQVTNMFKIIEENYGGVDVLVNNAGISEQRLFIDTEHQDWHRMMNTNLNSMYNCLYQALPYMISNQRGKVINMSSVWGLRGASCEVAYSTSKAAIIGITKALAKEYAPSNIQVNCIAPGVIDTEMNRHLTKEEMADLIEKIPSMRLGRSMEVAELVSFLCSDKSQYITGQVIGIDGGFGI